MYKRAFIILIAIVIVAIVVILATRPRKPAVTANPEPTDFADCITKYPVINGNPRTCVSPSGAVFTETVMTSTSTTATTTTTTPSPTTNNAVHVTSPTSGQKVSSPLTVTGQAPGAWYFEATFPIELRNSAGTVIATGQAHAQGDWMTASEVPFTATLTFPAQPTGSKGTLALKNDNPSGDPARDQSVSIPVTF